MLSVVIAGGGTGGHLYPGIAVAQEFVRRVPAVRVTFAGTARGLESRVLPRLRFELDLIRSAGLKGKALRARLEGLSLLGPSLADAWRILSRRMPAVVIGVGGYSSGPVVLVAALRGIPTMVLEQNASPGLTNRLLARIVRAAAVTYHDTLRFFHGKGFVSGNPVRAEFFAAGTTRTGDSPHAPDTDTSMHVLVLGGSQGAHAINVAVAALVLDLAVRRPAVTVVHQTGERDLASVRETYGRPGVNARASAFFDDVALEMSRADIVICRAGATTLAELAAVGRPAVLVPFPGAADDHQRKNAAVLTEAGAAILVDERDLTPARLADIVDRLAADRDSLSAMSRAMKAFSRPDAAAVIVTRALVLAGMPDAAGERDASAVRA